MIAFNLGREMNILKTSWEPAILQTLSHPIPIAHTVLYRFISILQKMKLRLIEALKYVQGCTGINESQDCHGSGPGWEITLTPLFILTASLGVCRRWGGGK